MEKYTVEQERTIKELLQIMLDNQEYFEITLCFWVDKLYILSNLLSLLEVIRLRQYILLNRPSTFSSIQSFINRNNFYYWNRGDIKPRIKWLKEHIKKNS